MEESILKWLEVGDSLQKLDVYNNKFRTNAFKIFYNISKNMYFSPFLHYILIIIFFAQIMTLNIAGINTENDKILNIIKNIEKILLFEKTIVDAETYEILLISVIVFFIVSLIVEIVNFALLIYGITLNFSLKILSFIQLVYIYYLTGPILQILIYPLLIPKGAYSIEGYFLKTVFFLGLIFAVVMILNVILISFYMNDINTINGRDYKSKLNDRYMTIIIIVKLIYFILEQLLALTFMEKIWFIYVFQIALLIMNFSMTIYCVRKVYFYNPTIDLFHHYGWYFTTWFSIGIFFKHLTNTNDITLFIIIGIILIIFSSIFNVKYKKFRLLTEFNILAENTIKDIEIYSNLLCNLSNQNNAQSKTLLAGIIKRSEESLKSNPELNEIYNKLISISLNQTLFGSINEVKVLSIIGVIYVNNEEKSRNKANISLNRCYFLINKCKNISLAIHIATKIIVNSHLEAYYKFVFLEEIKEYLVNKLKKNRNKVSIKNIQISSVILYSQLVDLFKLEIYDAVCSQIEYFDILKNNISTEKTTENFLKNGENILSLRNNILNIWNKMIELNPNDPEAEKDYMIYLDIIIQDEFLKKEEVKKYKEKKEEYHRDKNSLYFDMFDQEKSAILLCDGYSFNGKIFYYTPNFASLFGFTGKEISNISIDDLLPDVVQNFHKYILEENLRYTNLMAMFRTKRNVLLKGKNGLLFSIYLYVRIVPNLQYGLLYILYIQKVQEKNFMIILDDRMLIDGFTESGQINSNLTINNVSNYGLSQLVIGYHIGLIIPDILLQIDYDAKNEKYFFVKENIDLKGFFYPTQNSKEMSIKLKKILENIKNKKTKENDEDNNYDNFNPFDEFNDFIKELNLQNKKAYSIFYRIECRKFLQGKYRYYKIYITNDLLSENMYDEISNQKNNLISNTDNNIKENNSSVENPIKNNEKLIKLKINPNNLDNIKKKNINNIDNTNNNNDSKDLKINQNKINYSQPTSNSSSAQSKSNKESNEFHRLKNEIINKKDFFNIKLIKYLFAIYIILIDALIAYDYYITYETIYSLAKFLKQNLYFDNAKIANANVYTTALNLKLLKNNIIKIEDCPNSNCTSFYSDLLIDSYTEVRKQKYDLNDYYQEYLDIFNQKMKIESKSYQSSSENIYLDTDNYLNFLIANGLKIISNLTNYFNPGTFFGFSSDAILEVYIDNLLNTSYNFFYSDIYKGFKDKKKKELFEKYSENPPQRIIISISVFLLIIGIIIYLICRLYSTESFFLEKLLNFSSTNFDDYLKKLEELKKSLRDENNEDEDKNMEDNDPDEELEDKNENENKSLEKNKDLKEGFVKKKEKYKKKKNKQNKLHMQRLKKRKNMSNYFFKFNILFAVKIGISFLILIFYFFITMLIFANYRSNFVEFDESLVEINTIFLNIYNTTLHFKRQVQKFHISKNPNDIIIPNDNDIIQPKLGNTLFNIIHNSKYNKDSLEKIKRLYNDNACDVLGKNITNDKYCTNIFSSVLVKGLDQVIVQMSIILNNCLDELSMLKIDKNLANLYSINNFYYNYELLVSYYLFNSFLITKEIFDVFRNDEINYIIRIQQAVTIVYILFIVLICILCIYFIYQYKNVGNSFWNFIGILPNKFISDDDNFYDSIIKLGELLY